MYKNLRDLSSKRFSLPKEQEVRKTIRSFTIAERAVFSFFALFFVVSGLILLLKVNGEFLVEVPTTGGKLVEGVVGNPRFINPVLAISEADKNLVSLVYSGLVRLTPQGELVNDLAANITISDNRQNYTVALHPEARFHDGNPITADDIIFTVQKIIDPAIKSPRRGNWEGVTIEKVDDLTVIFTLKQPYTPFLYNLTIGILPKHIWKNVTNDEFSFSQFNTYPIGSGPYAVKDVTRNSGGIPNFYQLEPFSAVLGQAPFIKTLEFKFYSSEEALLEAFDNHEIESLSGLSPENLAELNLKDSSILSAPLPRVFAVFLNQSKSRALLQPEVRRALDLAAPKEEIIKEVLLGQGSAIEGPLPAGSYAGNSIADLATTTEGNILEAQAILAKAGWKPNVDTGVLEKKSGSATITLSFSISTGDANELKEVANRLALSWQKLGAAIEVLSFETGDLNQTVIRPRNFDALLFGEVVGRDADLYPFWHSSQRADPGLNIALYANSKADKLLEDARSATTREKAREIYLAFSEELKRDRPAVFLYTPSFLYVAPKQVHAIDLGQLAVSQDRFLGIREWYIETDHVWKIFAEKQ